MGTAAFNRLHLHLRQSCIEWKRARPHLCERTYEGGTPYEDDITMNEVNIVFMANLQVLESFLTIF